MAAFCLTKQAVDSVKEAFRNGELNPFKLADMDSAGRREALSKYVGKDNATQVNALFESKLLLNNKKAGYISWAKKLTGLAPEVKNDFLSKVEKLDRVLNPEEEAKFLKDLVDTRLNLDVSPEQAKTLSDLANKVAQNKEAFKQKLKENPNLTEKEWNTSDERFKYGAEQAELENYTNKLKLDAKKVSFREAPVKKTIDAITSLPGIMKSSLSTLDNSLWGRQGLKTLLDPRTTGIWVRNFAKSFKDIGTALKGGDPMDIVKADIYSRYNALNGKYAAGKYGLDVLSEEAFPSSFPEKIPAFGRLFKASEAAYNGGALRLRADLADRLIRIAERNGIDTLNKAQAEPIGQLVRSITGRGSIGKAEVLAKEINSVAFSIKFLKSNFDALASPFDYAGRKIGEKVGLETFKNEGEKFAKREAAKNMLRIVGTVSAIMTVANALNPNSVELDPRSKNFGKINIFGHWTDITGGMGGLVTLAAKITPTWHNGVLSQWRKEADGSFTDLRAGGFAAKNVLDNVEQFFDGKLSPVASLVNAEVFKGGKDPMGQPITAQSALQNAFVPLPIQNFNQFMSDPNSSSVLGSMILDGLGLSVSSNTPKSDWNTSTTAELQGFKDKVGQDKFNQANDEYDKQYNAWFNRMKDNAYYKNLDDKGKKNLITLVKNTLRAQVLKQYGYEYKRPKVSAEQRKNAKNAKEELKKRILNK